MPRRTLRALAAAGALLLFFLVPAEALARGGGRGGGGFSRGGGGFSRGGGSFGRSGGFGAGRPTPNISRSGPADRGTFGGRDPFGGSGNSRSTTRPAVPLDRPQGSMERPPNSQEGRTERQENRQEGRSDRLEDRLENREEAREDFKEYVDDNTYSYEEYYEDRWRYSVGASITAVHFRSMTCESTTVVVGSTTYYHCGSTWYSRAYSGGNVTYIVVNPPPGH